MPITYDKIATVTTTGLTDTITFSSIPSTYTDLILAGKMWCSGGGVASFTMRYNNDTNNIYSLQRLYYNGTPTPFADVTNTSSNAYAGIIDSNGGAIGDGSTIEFQIYDYANTTTNKNAFCRTDNGSSGVYSSWYAHQYRSNTAIDRIDIITAANMVVGTNLTLYGIKAA